MYLCADTPSSACSLLITRFAASKHNCAWLHDLFCASQASRTRAYNLILLIERLGITLSPQVIALRGLIDSSWSSDDASAQQLRLAFHAVYAHGTLHPPPSRLAWVKLCNVSGDLAWRIEEQHGRPPPVLIFDGVNETNVIHWAEAQIRMLTVVNFGLDPGYCRAMRQLRGGGGDEADDDAGVDRRLHPALAWPRRPRQFDLLPDDPETDPGTGSDPDEDGLPDTDYVSMDALLDRLRGEDGAMSGRQPAARVARFHEESPEEAEVRRRRRTAMVLHDGAGAITREDILEFPWSLNS